MENLGPILCPKSWIHVFFELNNISTLRHWILVPAHDTASGRPRSSGASTATPSGRDSLNTMPSRSPESTEDAWITWISGWGDRPELAVLLRCLGTRIQGLLWEVDGSGLLVSLSNFSKTSEVKEAEIVAETVTDLDESPSKALGFGDAGMFGVRLNSKKASVSAMKQNLTNSPGLKLMPLANHKQSKQILKQYHVVDPIRNFRFGWLFYIPLDGKIVNRARFYWVYHLSWPRFHPEMRRGKAACCGRRRPELWSFSWKGPSLGPKLRRLRWQEILPGGIRWFLKVQNTPATQLSFSLSHFLVTDKSGGLAKNDLVTWCMDQNHKLIGAKKIQRTKFSSLWETICKLRGPWGALTHPVLTWLSEVLDVGKKYHRRTSQGELFFSFCGSWVTE